jgi:uncharacterized membrane protein YidH (DUF202 family)
VSDPRQRRREIPEDIEVADPGLARERTRLAWTRSSISFAAIGVVLLKDRPVIGAPVLILSAVVWSIGRWRRAPGRGGVARKRILFVTVCVTTVAIGALIIALAGPPSHGLRL